MEIAALVVVIAILAAALFFLVRAFVRLQKQLMEVKGAMKDLGDMGPRLQRLGQDMGKLVEGLEEEHRQ